MEEDGTQAKGQQEQQQEIGQHPEDIQRQGDPVDRHSDEDESIAHQHLEALDQHRGQQQDELGQIDLGQHRLKLLDGADAGKDAAVEEGPGVVSDEDKGAEVALALAEDHRKHEGIHQHEQQRVQHPPQPVEEGASHLVLELGLGGVEHIPAVFFDVTDKSNHKTFLF